jgi:hypothetical protein
MTDRRAIRDKPGAQGSGQFPMTQSEYDRLQQLREQSEADHNRVKKE